MPSSKKTLGRFFALPPAWLDGGDALTPADGLTNAEVCPTGVLTVGDGTLAGMLLVGVGTPTSVLSLGDGTLAGAVLVDGAPAGMLLVGDGTPTSVLLVKDGTTTKVLPVGDGTLTGVCTGVADENVEEIEG